MRLWSNRRLRVAAYVMVLEVAALMVLWSMWEAPTGLLVVAIALVSLVVIPLAVGMATGFNWLLPTALLTSFPVSLLTADLFFSDFYLGGADTLPLCWVAIMTLYYGGAATVCYGLGAGARILVRRARARRRDP